ncbi:hypothetical protein ABZ754_13710 [Micromonospora purpureochromogenes]|uniref:hypothetical protein n=1 Tax=Micromonospora purpureochromogenes TaxID=47872 RepID=UPI0033D4B8D2
MTETGSRRAAAPLASARRWVVPVATLGLVASVAACGQTPVAPLPVRPPTPAAAPSTPAAAAPSAPPGPATLAATPRPSVPVGPAPTRSRGTRSPSPSPRSSACLGPVRYDLDLAETEVALLKSLCLTAGGVLRIQGIGPGEVTVDREDLVSRSYEAGVQDIRFLRAGTVGVTIPQGGEAHTVAVVVV